MLRASLSGLLSYRGRLTATVLAIVLGVGFVTGTLVFTDALRTTFYDRFAQAERGVDAAVTARDDGRLDETALDAARAVPGVAVAEPRLADQVRILDRDGRPHAPDRRERTLGISVASDPRLRWHDAPWLTADGWLWLPCGPLGHTPRFHGGQSRVEWPARMYGLRV